MKKFFLIMLLLVATLSTTQFVSAAPEPEAKNYESTNTNTSGSYWKVRNSWGIQWQKIDIFSPSGDLVQTLTNVANGTEVSTSGFDQGEHTAILTDETGSYSETFTVN